MTASEQAEKVLALYEKLNANAAPGVSDAEMSIYLTNAQWLYVISRVTPLLNIKREGLEETEIRIQGLSALIETANIGTFTQGADNLPNGYFCDLPMDFMFTIYEDVTIDKLSCVTNLPARIPIYVISHNDFSKNDINPFKKPYFNRRQGLVWRLTNSRLTTGFDSQTQISLDPVTGNYEIPGQSAKRHELISNGNFTFVNYFLRYLKIPRAIISTLNGDGSTTQQINCELDEMAQETIIQMAVDIMKDSAQQPNQKSIAGMQQNE